MFTNLTVDHISAASGFSQPKERAGFIKAYTTVDRIHTINRVIRVAYNKLMYIKFVDYANVFDSVVFDSEDSIFFVMK